ncbi:unnamed protein product [Ascophyllum nodosum]
MLNNLLSPRVKRGGSSAEAAARDLINFYKDCSCKKVFADVRGGKLPPLSEQDITDEEMIAEVRASPVYSTVTLASGPASAVHLEETSKQADDHVDVCCQVPEEIFKDDARDTTMFGTTSMLSFSELVGKVSLDRVVKVVYKYKEQKVGHIAVVGPNGFQLCTCLQLLRTGL